jgi:hypothetical protein
MKQDKKNGVAYPQVSLKEYKKTETTKISSGHLSLKTGSDKWKGNGFFFFEKIF